MRTISVRELRQNPTAMLDAVEGGEVYAVTRHNKVIARITPVRSPGVELTPARHHEGLQLAKRPRRTLASADSVEELVEWAKRER